MTNGQFSLLGMETCIKKEYCGHWQGFTPKAGRPSMIRYDKKYAKRWYEARWNVGVLVMIKTFLQNSNMIMAEYRI